VKVQVGSDTRIENSYNALNWRVSSRADTDVPGDGSLDEERIMYYNAGWQLVEEDIYEDWSSGNPGAVDERRAHFWGARYIDDLVQTLVDGNADGDYVDTSGDDESFFFLSDAQFSVTVVLDGNANLQERVVYDAYGEANHHDWRDTDGDGDPSGGDATDRSTINTLASASPSGTPITNASYEPDADLDRDGDVDSTDLSLGGTTYPTPLNKGELSLPAVGNRFGYDGYRFNPETEQYTVRHRHYDPILGRWLERDPAGYVDGGNLLSYVGEQPHMQVDPKGMWTFVPGMVEFDAKLSDASYSESKFELDAFFTKALRNSCCAEVRFLQVYYATVEGFHLIEGITLGEWTVDDEGAPDPPFYDDVAGTPQTRLLHSMNDSPHRFGGAASQYYHFFETCLVCSVADVTSNGRTYSISGGDVYGCIQWGHRFNYNTGPLGLSVGNSWHRQLHDRSWSSDGTVRDLSTGRVISRNGMPGGTYRTKRFQPGRPQTNFMRQLLGGMFPNVP